MAEQLLKKITYDPILEARHAEVLTQAKAFPWDAAKEINEIRHKLEDVYGDNYVAGRLHLARLERDKALIWTREKVSCAYDTRAYLAAGLVRNLGSNAQNLTESHVDIKNLTNDYTFTGSAKVELENQIAATGAHMGRILVAQYCILEKYPECHIQEFKEETARTQILDKAVLHLQQAYANLEVGIHNSYFMASIAGNALRIAALANQQQLKYDWHARVVMHRNRALQNMSLPDEKRAFLTSCRLQWESRSRKAAMKAVLLGNI